MNKSFLHLYLFTTIFWFSTNSYAGNGWVSSGGDEHPDTYAWFTGDNKITACIERENLYPKSKEQLELMIHKASLTWKNYYHQKVIPSKPNRTITLQFDFLFQECSSETEVKFYFGVNHSDVQNEMKKYYSPLAFATMQSYDFQKGRGKGFVWFQNVESLDSGPNQEALQGLILHELGHLYGNSHISETIMDEKIVEIIGYTGANGGYPYDSPFITKMMNSIDWKNPLYFNLNTEWTYSGHLPVDQINPSYASKQREIAKSLLGRDSIGNVNIQLIKKIPGSSYNTFNLVLTDDLGSVTTYINGISDATITTGPAIFKIQGNHNQAVIQSHYSELFGSIKGLDGKIYSAVYTFHMGNISNPVKIRILNEGKSYLFFVLGKPGTHYER